MKFKILLIFGFILINSNLFGQNEKLYQLEVELIDGDKDALRKLGSFLDDKQKTIEFLGHHLLKPMVKDIALRIISENCLFLSNEIVLDEKITTKKFIQFLKDNEKQIHFDQWANQFLITPITERKAEYSVQGLSESKQKELKAKASEILNYDWVIENGIEKLIKSKNPLVLARIASEFYKTRSRFNVYYFNENEFLDLMKLLTGIEIGVRDKKNTISYLFENDYYAKTRLNYLIYWVNNYRDYQWDEIKNIFVNPNLKIKYVEKEQELFELLKSEDDTIALNAFIELSVSNPEKVRELAEEYEYNHIDANFILPTFPYRFLKQLVMFTAYCKTNQIKFEADVALKAKLTKLEEYIPFSERYKLENQLIEELSLEDITKVEYWGLIYHQKSFRNNHSIGRILDKFYSKNWLRLIQNEKQLLWYLKKSKLFEELGIIGICNNYLYKFINSSPEIIQILQSLKSADKDITEQIDKINAQKKPKTTKVEKSNETNNNSKVDNLEKELDKLLKSNLELDDKQNELEKLISKINYTQIGTVIKQLKEVESVNYWQKYEFIGEDFGIPTEDLDDEINLREFVEKYQSLSEYDLYTYYLKKNGFDYQNEDGSFNYDKIYEILKYDIVITFVGGGGSKRETGVYAIIKLLELKFNTTLGFPRKVCNSQGIFACSADDRVKEWIEYLRKKKLLKQEDKEPVSFSFE